MQDYGANWSDYRRRQWLAILVPVFLAPVALAIGSTTSDEALSVVSAVAWGGGSFAAWSWFMLFRCPYCGKRFHITKVLSLSLGKKCPHCGLARYASA
jgi:DNA-directed RNA polymerase subunit RPC12/RpoP